MATVPTVWESVQMRRPSAFLAGALLMLIFVGAKLAIVWPLTTGRMEADLLAVCAEDVALAVGFGVVAHLLLGASGGRAGLQRWVWRGMMGVGAVAALYAIVNVGIYRHLRQPLNFRLLRLIGKPADLRSSIAANSDAGVVAALIFVPIGYVMALRRFSRLSLGRRPRAALVLVALTWMTVGFGLRAHTPVDGWQRRAAKNAHRELVGSTVAWLFFNQLGADAGTYPASYLDDFRLAGQRSAAPPLKEFSPPPRNLILIVLESTTAQYMSLYGSKYATTPRLVDESRHALVFERFYAHIGYTFCSMMPLVYGEHPGLPWCYRPVGKRESPPGLAGLLRARGMRTAYFSVADPEWNGMDMMVKKAGMDEVFGPAEMGGPMASSWGTEDGVAIDALTRWVAKSPEKPFFAMVWTDQTHHPYTLARDTVPVQFVAKSAFQTAEDLNRYLNGIRQADRHLGRLFDWLRGARLADDTLVVITGDHGEAFGELHDVIGHGGGMFDENLRVPLMMWSPRLFPEGRRSEKVGGHMDLVPTLAQVYGVKEPPDWQGTSLFSDDHPGRVYLQADVASRQFGLTDERYKYMKYVENHYERLYDLKADPRELHDLSKDEAVLTAEFSARVSAFLHAEEAYMRGADPAKPFEIQGGK